MKPHVDERIGLKYGGGGRAMRALVQRVFLQDDARRYSPDLVVGPAEMDVARSMVRANGAVAAAVDTARRYVDEAVAALEPVAETPGGRALRAAAEQLLLSIPTAVV